MKNKYITKTSFISTIFDINLIKSIIILIVISLLTLSCDELYSNNNDFSKEDDFIPHYDNIDISFDSIYNITDSSKVTTDTLRVDNIYRVYFNTPDFSIITNKVISNNLDTIYRNSTTLEVYENYFEFSISESASVSFKLTLENKFHSDTDSISFNFINLKNYLIGDNSTIYKNIITPNTLFLIPPLTKEHPAIFTHYSFYLNTNCSLTIINSSDTIRPQPNTEPNSSFDTYIYSCTNSDTLSFFTNASQLFLNIDVMDLNNDILLHQNYTYRYRKPFAPRLIKSYFEIPLDTSYTQYLHYSEHLTPYKKVSVEGDDSNYCSASFYVDETITLDLIKSEYIDSLQFIDRTITLSFTDLFGFVSTQTLDIFCYNPTNNFDEELSYSHMRNKDFTVPYTFEFDKEKYDYYLLISINSGEIMKVGSEELVGYQIKKEFFNEGYNTFKSDLFLIQRESNREDILIETKNCLIFCPI